MCLTPRLNKEEVIREEFPFFTFTDILLHTNHVLLHNIQMNKNMARQRPSYLNLLQLVGILIIAVVLISHYLNYFTPLSIIINNNLQLAQSSAGKYKGHVQSKRHFPEEPISPQASCSWPQLSPFTSSSTL